MAIETSTKEVIRKGIASSLYRELLDPNGSYFVVLGRSYKWDSQNGVVLTAGGETIPYPTDDMETYGDSMRDGFFAKRVGANDVRLMSPLVQWTRGTRYSKYASNVNIFDESYLFYVYTSDGSVYKCLENGRNREETGLPSLYEPNIKDTANPFTTPDGYKWKFMFTVPDYERRLVTQFTNETNYFPVSISNGNYSFGERILQYEVQENATPGTVDSVIISPLAGLSGGNGANASFNVCVSTAKSLDYKIITGLSGATTMTIGSASLVSQATNIYKDYTITITNGLGAGISRQITGYTYAASGGVLSFTNPLPRSVPTGSNYQIAPTLKILGDGVSAEGYLKLTEYPKSFDLEKFVVTNSGRNYTVAYLANPGPSGSLVNFDAHANVSPPGGHGYNAINELNPTYVQMCVDINGGETASTLQLADGEFRQIMILKDPLLWNSGQVAGTENSRMDEVIVRTLTTNADISQLKVGNYIFGETSRSVGKIENIRNTGRDWILLIKGLNGKLIQSASGANGESVSLYSHSVAGAEFKRISKDIGVVVSSTQYLGANSTNQVYKLTTTIGITGALFELGTVLTDYKKGYAYVSGLCADKFNSRVFSIRRVSGVSASHYVEISGVVGIDNLISLGTGGSLSIDRITTDGTVQSNAATGQIVSVDPPAFEPLSGEIVYIENTESKTRSRVQTERVSILIKI